MFSFVQNWFAARGANPIGIDFGTDCLRMAQVQITSSGEPRLLAAASADVPSHARHDASARANFFVETARDLLAQGRFHGRQAVLALPASSMFIQHLRVAKMDDEAMKKALPWEARGKLPIDPNAALMRHVVAGEVYQDQEPRQEVILMAASREGVNQYLAAAARARLDVVGMNVEPKALIDCFAHIYRRKTDAEATSCFVDIGNTATRAIIARGGQILFARVIPIGGERFTRAVAEAMNVSAEEAKLLRIKLCCAQPQFDDAREKQQIAPDSPGSSGATAGAGTGAEGSEEAQVENSLALLSAGMSAHEKTRSAGQHQVASATPPARAAEQACREPLNRLIEELNSCREYYEATFPNKPVDRLIFVGGEARQRSLCQHVAKQMSLAAQVGDPLVRMGRISDVGIESGIDRRQPQPGWAVAIGLSLGPVGAPAKVEAR